MGAPITYPDGADEATKTLIDQLNVASTQATESNSVPAPAAIFSRSFLSKKQIATANARIKLEHGLKQSPTLVQAELICKNAENGYLVGEKYIGITGMTFASGNYGINFTVDSANINVIIGGNNILVIHKTSGALSGITPANWDLYIRAWA